MDTQWATRHYHSHWDETTGSALGCFVLAMILQPYARYELKKRFQIIASPRLESYTNSFMTSPVKFINVLHFKHIYTTQFLVYRQYAHGLFSKSLGDSYPARIRFSWHCLQHICMPWHIAFTYTRGHHAFSHNINHKHIHSFTQEFHGITSLINH